MAKQIRPYAKGIEAIIVSIIYDKPLPKLYAGLYVNEGARLWWLGGEVVEPLSGYSRIELETDEKFWLRDGPAVEYKDPVIFKCESLAPRGWGRVWGWIILDEAGVVILCEKFTKSPFLVRKGEDVQIRVRLRL